MSKLVKAALVAGMGLGGFFSGPGVPSIPSHQIKPTRQKHTWSKRTMQRMKGKAARKNRGRNRAKYKGKL